MAHLQTAYVIGQVTDVALHVNYVRQDPEVIKAARTAGRDIAAAGRSTCHLVQVSRESWHRYTPHRPSPIPFAVVA